MTVPDPWERIDRLERRIAALEAKDAVLRTLVDYGVALDDGDEELMVGCFAPGGSWELRRDGVVTRRYAAPEEFRAWVRRHHERPHPPHKHVITNPAVVVEDDDTARATTYFLRIDAETPESGGRPFVFAMGRYEDELVRCDDGAWRFRSRVAHMEDGPRAPV